MVSRILATVLVLIASASYVGKVYHDAKVRPIRIMVVCGHNVNCARAIRVAQAAVASTARDVGREMSIVAAYSVHDDLPSHSLLRVLFWLNKTAVSAKSNKADATLVFVEPFSTMQDTIDMDEESILGRASGIGNVGQGYALAWAKLVGSDKYSTMVAKHELGHLLGAMHSRGENIMNSEKADQFPHFSEEQVRTINAILALLP